MWRWIYFHEIFGSELFHIRVTLSVLIGDRVPPVMSSTSLILSDDGYFAWNCRLYANKKLFQEH